MDRPGGRTARVRAAVLRAVGDVLAEAGLAGLELNDIASRAQVGKTTVYRRWGSASALIADLLVDMAATSLPRAHTGTVEGDLRANARLVQKTLDDARQGRLLTSLIAAATTDADTAVALQHFYDVRIAEWSPCVEEAIARGELPTGTGAADVIGAVSAPLYYHRLTRADPIGRRRADTAAKAAVAAARAGVFTAH